MNGKRMCVAEIAMIGIILALAPVARAQNTFTTANGYWDVPGNWSLGQVPTNGENVLVGVNLRLTNATETVGVCVVTNSAIVTFSNIAARLNAQDVFVVGTAKLTHSINSATTTNAFGGWDPDARVYVVCTNFTLGPAATVDANSAGYKGANNATGYGPGRGTGHATTGRGAGGGHGGTGGAGTFSGGMVNDSTNAPAQPGSSGGGVYNGGGGNGGGLVRLDVTSALTLNGTVSANGATPTSQYSGGGAGGGIHITCGTLGGTGTVSAIGKAGGATDCGGGGGGRIAVIAAASAGWAGNYRVEGGTAGTGGAGQSGTLFLSGASKPASIPAGINWRVYGITNWVSDSLTLSNATLVLEENGVQINLTSNLVVSGGSTLSVGHDGDVETVAVQVGGDLIVTNSGSVFRIYSGATNAVVTNGAVLTVGGVMRIAATLSLYSHPTNGGSVRMTAANVEVTSTGTIGANGFGPRANGTGWGTGGGASFGGGQGGGGGGYGGLGGNGLGPTAGGGTYGSSNAPVDAGSAGGSYTSSGSYLGGRGGGVVRLDAGSGTIRVDGIVSADAAAASTYAGGGSGGSVYLTCGTMAGTGTLSAKGSNGGASGGGGGGGGRIAVIYSSAKSFTGSMTAAQGTGNANGQTGTVVVLLQSVGTYQLDVRGVPGNYGAPSPYGNAVHAVTVGSSVTNTVVSPADEAGGVRHICTGWALTNTLGAVASGATTQSVFQMTTNLFQTWFWYNEYYLTVGAGPSGTVNNTGWYSNGVSVTVTASPFAGYHFSQWTGADVPPGAQFASPLQLTMSRPLQVQAHFAADTPQAKTWSGTGNWASDTNWSPAGMPGAADSATIASGTITLSDPVRLNALTVNGTLDFDTTNAVLDAAGNVTVTGTVSHSAQTDTNAPWVMDNWVRIVAGSMTISTGAVIDVSGKGFAAPSGTSGYGPGKGTGGGMGTGGSGAGHGGAGGNGQGSIPGGGVYDSSNAPALPGSGGGGNTHPTAGGAGGGYVWIDVLDGRLTVNGSILANGNAAGGWAGGGSGGGIYLNCMRLAGTGQIRARGGSGTDFGGGGGGGRIAVRSASYSQWSGTLDVPSSVPGGAHGPSGGTDGGSGTVVWDQAGYRGSQFLFR